jgi:hypothetical protein
MPETNELRLTYREAVEAFLKQSNIHEGLWTLSVKFGLAAANIGQSDQELKPMAILSVLSLGISRADKLTNLTVDASVVNPAPAPKPTTKRKASFKS